MRYVDFDYLALESHEKFFNKYPDIDLFLQQQNHFILGFEWAFARYKAHPYISFLMKNVTVEGFAPDSGGPHKINKTFHYFFGVDQIETMVNVGRKTMVVSKELISPLSYDPWKVPQGDPVMSCAIMMWGREKQGLKKFGPDWNQENFEKTECYADLKKDG